MGSQGTEVLPLLPLLQLQLGYNRTARTVSHSLAADAVAHYHAGFIWPYMYVLAQAAADVGSSVKTRCPTDRRRCPRPTVVMMQPLVAGMAVTEISRIHRCQGEADIRASHLGELTKLCSRSIAQAAELKELEDGL
jgi:hypothetical protein